MYTDKNDGVLIGETSGCAQASDAAALLTIVFERGQFKNDVALKNNIYSQRLCHQRDIWSSTFGVLAVLVIIGERVLFGSEIRVAGFASNQ